MKWQVPFRISPANSMKRARGSNDEETHTKKNGYRGAVYDVIFFFMLVVLLLQVVLMQKGVKGEKKRNKGRRV